jgi:hypothetical protein
MNKIKLYCYITFAICIFLLFSCTQNQTGFSKELEHALRLAGNNRPELEKVLQHYKNDELKLRAALFLIENMPHHYSYADTALFNRFNNELDSLALYVKNSESDSFNLRIYSSAAAGAGLQPVS